MRNIHNLASLWGLAAALQTVIFDQSGYGLQGPIDVYEGNMFDFINLDYLSAIGGLRDHGGVQINALPHGYISIDQLTLYEKSFFNITAQGCLKLVLKETFSIGVAALFIITSGGDLFLCIAEPEGVFMNGGKSVFQGQGTIDFTAGTNLINAGKMNFLSPYTGTFLFLDILNLDSISIQTASSRDLMSFKDLVNQGLFSVVMGTGPRLSIEGRGAITNSGVIDLTGLYIQGRFMPRKDVLNDGLMCLLNIALYHSASISGMGCISLQKHGAIYLDTNCPFASSQGIVLGDNTAFIRVVDFSGDSQVMNIYGLMNQPSAIRSIHKLDAAIYDLNTGHLLVYNRERDSVEFSIGLGYDEAKFSVRARGVTYRGYNPTQRPIPAQCKCPITFW